MLHRVVDFFCFSRAPSCLVVLSIAVAACGCNSSTKSLDVESLAENEWTWIDVPESRCMNGTSTGFGINPTRSSNKVLIFLEPGGACFDDDSCDNGLRDADASFTEDDFPVFMLLYQASGLLNREDRDNPFADWNLVFVPYCSGDVFAGNTADGYAGRVQQGAVNLSLYLAAIREAWSSPDKVMFSGMSAGGFGALNSTWRIRQMFPDTSLYVFSDSGPALSDDYMRPCLQQHWRNVWNLDASLPPDCEDCQQTDGGGLRHVLDYALASDPKLRVGLVSRLRDSTLRYFFGFGYSQACENGETPERARMPPADLEAGLLETREHFAGRAYKTFLVEGTDHTFVLPSTSATVHADTNLSEWLTQMVNDDPTWDDVGPE